jgi:POT family proton-dependent oligopeptide transporter
MGLGTFYAGLGLLIIGNGFFKPNISIIVGQLYRNDDPKKDGAFNIFYMGINLGAFLAPLVCGFLAEDFMATKETLADGSVKIAKYGFQYGFLAAGIGMTIGQIMFNVLGQKYLGDKGLSPQNKNVAAGDIIDEMGETVSSGKLNKQEKDRTWVIIILVAFVTFFWAGFEQAGGTFSLYTDKYINREVSNFLIPTSFFQSVNPIFIVMLAPLFTLLWGFLNKKGTEPNTPVKMGLGMILLGLGFLLMVGAVLQRGGAGTDETVKAHILWMLGTYLIHTCGELCLSPIGLSMVTKLAPVKLASMLMGVWFLSSFIANNLAGLTVGFVKDLGPMNIFAGIAGFVIVLGLVLIGMNKMLLKMMHGVR